MCSETGIKDRAKHINWDTAVFMALFHVGIVAALFMWSWQALFVTILLCWISASLGSASAQRADARLTHQALYKEWARARHD